MAWGALQWVKVTKEQDNSGNPTYGVFTTKTTLVEGTDFSWFRLTGNNAFTARPVPASYTIRSADGLNRRVQYGSARTAVQGTLATLFYPNRAQFLLDMACNLVNNDLMSYTFEFFDTQQTYRLLGGKAGKLTLRSDAQTQYIPCQTDWTFQQPATGPPALAAPTSANFPSVLPYHHQDSLGQVLVNAVARAKYSSLELTIDNKLGMTWDESPYITACFWAGRDIDYTLKSQYASTADRTAFQGVTKQITNQIKWTKGGNSVTLDLKSTNYITGIDDDLPLDNAAYQTLKCGVLYDPTANTDLTYTVV